MNTTNFLEKTRDVHDIESTRKVISLTYSFIEIFIKIWVTQVSLSFS